MKTGYFSLSFFVTLLLGFFAYLQTDGFSPLWLIRPSFELQSLPASREAIDALSQPYRYLARGRQSFVFESCDGKYVVKFFNAPYLYLLGNSDKRKFRRHLFKQGYVLAWDRMPEQTGLVYLHLGLGGEGLPKISCCNRAGADLEVDLAHTAFVLQKKGGCFAETLPDMFKNEGDKAIQKVIDSWFALIDYRLNQSITDADSNVILNYGIVEGRVVQLDPGRIRCGFAIDKKQEWEKSSRQFRAWLNTNIPQCIPYFDQQYSKFIYK